MEHDRNCERPKVVSAIDTRYKLTGVERSQLVDDLVVELCFCWDRLINPTFSPTFAQATDRVARGIGLVKSGRCEGPVGVRQSWTERRAQALRDAGSIEVPEGRVIEVDFEKRRRM